MPGVHCISRKWLKQRKYYQACLRQAERMAKEVSLLSGKNNGAVTISAACPPSSAHPPSSKDTAPPLDNSIDHRVRLEPSGRQHAAPSKKRRSARHSHDDGNNSSVVTPRDKSTASTNNDDQVSAISDSPVKNTRKRKLRSGASLAISEAISVGIVPHDNDFICLGQGGPNAGVSTNTSGYHKVREWANNRKDNYDLAQKKSTVLNEALNLLREMDPPGRILQKKRYGQDEYWVELEDKMAIEKIRYYCFRFGHDIRGNSSEMPPTQDLIMAEDVDVRDISSELCPAEDPLTSQASICIASEREDVMGIDEDSEMEESIENNGVSERDEVSKILNSMVKVVDSVANDETLSTHVDEEWLIEEKKVQALLKEAFKQANATNDHARWKSLQEHSDEIKESFITDLTFRLWWNDFDSRTRSLPRACIKVMISFCRQQRMTSYYTQDLAVLAPPGKLGIVLEMEDTGFTPSANVVGRLRISSVMANQVCPGDRIVAIDDEDVRHMSVQEISSIMARKNDEDKVLVIKPSLASTIEFTKLRSTPPSFQSNVEIMIFTYVKAHITANRMRYNEVRVLLQLPPYILCEEVGGKLCELYAEYGSNFDGAWTCVIPKLANWWATVIDSKRQQSFDMSTLIKASAPIVPDTISSTLESIGLSKIQEICDCVKTYITMNQMQYDDVCDLLHLRPSSALEIVGHKLRELHNELGSNKFGMALSQAKKHVLYWFESTSVPSLDGIGQSNVSTEQALEAIVDGKVVRVRVTQDASLECTDIPDRSKRNGLTDDDKHKIAQVIESAASLPHCEKTQRACFSAIRKYISIPNKELPSLTSHNMLTNAIVVGMKAHPERCNIQADALSTLSQMVWSLPAAAKQMVNEEGCLQLAIDAMEFHASHSKTQQSACELFVALSYDKTCCQVMLDSDVISSVLNSIKGCLKKSQPKALASGLLFLQNMAVISLDNVANSILSEENVLSTLLRTIQTKTSNTNLLISLFGLLSNLALHTDVRSRIADAGGVEIIQDRLASIKNAQLLLLALKTLLNLALNTAVAKTLAENYCAYEVVAHAHARASRDNPDLLLISLGLLDKLIDTEVAANQNEVASGAESIALAALGDHPSNKQLRSVAISVLQKVSE